MICFSLEVTDQLDPSSAISSDESASEIVRATSNCRVYIREMLGDDISEMN